MRNHTVAVLVAAVLSTPALGQAKPGEPIRLALHPAAPPTPSLKYQLLPDRSEQLPGNAAAGYYRALAMFVENLNLLQEIKKDYWHEWLALPLKEMPLAEAKEKVALARHLIKEVEVRLGAGRPARGDRPTPARRPGISPGGQRPGRASALPDRRRQF